MDEKELARRRRVVHGWAFRNLSDKEVAEIRAWITGESNQCPEKYQRVNDVVR